MVARTSLLISSIALLTSFVNAYGQVAQIVDKDNFCVFLPPTDSKDRIISDTEWNAQAFCKGKAPKAKKAGKLASGFIQSAHYVKTDDYVQITGQIDPATMDLDLKDYGGQYDVKAPKGATCAGWKYFVNLIEPAGSTYCIRCCNDPVTCNRGISSKGCFHIIPGDYTGPVPDAVTPSGGDSATTTDGASSTKSGKATSTKKSSSKTASAGDATTTAEPTTTDGGLSLLPSAGGDSSSDDSSSADSSDAAYSVAPAPTDAPTDASTDAAYSVAPVPSSSSSAAGANAAAEIASPAPSASSDGSVINEQSVQQSQQQDSGVEALRPVLLTLAITAASMALIQ